MASYFSGEYECKLDDKGRLVLPARFKSALPEGEGEVQQIVLARGFEPCLTIYPLHEWAKIFEKVAALNEFNPEYRNFQRNFLRGNTEIELDKSGRFLVPKTMVRYAKLERDAILVGMGNRIELWNPEVYEEYLIKDQQTFSELAKQFLGKEEPKQPEAPIVPPTAQMPPVPYNMPFYPVYFQQQPVHLVPPTPPPPPKTDEQTGG